MTGLSKEKIVGVVGAGTMGIGIAQVAAAAGHKVKLFDAFDDAARKSLERLGKSLSALVEKGKMQGDEAAALLDRITISPDLAEFSDVALVVEAIVEDLEVKRRLFAQLEEIVAPDAVLGTNTSSISVTLIARDLKYPGRVVGMHFFNPAPVMKLVEVVHGVATHLNIAELVHATARDWGKVAVHAKSTPGFIVNRVARAYYAEPLRLFEEGVADPATLDALFTQGAGFRMGPFALMDLIGNDVNYAVSRSVFDAFYGEPRFRPSNLQLELVNAGRLGRKSGRGFYDYTPGAEQPQAATSSAAEALGTVANFALEVPFEIDGTAVRLSDGRTAAAIAREIGQPVVLLDLTAGSKATRVGFTTSPNVSSPVVDTFVASAAKAGLQATRLPDWPGLVALRTIAMIANEGFEAILQGVADEDSVDDAMRHGVNYPQGPIGWAREVGLRRILSVLETLLAVTGDPRYRPSFALRRAADAS